MEIKNIEDFMNINKENINSILQNMTKNEIINFCNKNDIPYKRYYSKTKLLEDTASQIFSICTFIKIAR